MGIYGHEEGTLILDRLALWSNTENRKLWAGSALGGVQPVPAAQADSGPLSGQAVGGERGGGDGDEDEGPRSQQGIAPVRLALS